MIDQHGRLSIAKFPKETDDYSMATWEEIALRLAGRAGIATPCDELLQVGRKAMLLSWRFDRDGAIRIPFLSAMAMTGPKDGERGSYPEIVDALTGHGAQAETDAQALYRRVTFNVLVSNVDDHLRNHGFLWLGKGGWSPPSMMPIQCRPPRENRERRDRFGATRWAYKIKRCGLHAARASNADSRRAV